MQGIMFDITERKLAEAALQESEERFRQLAESIDEIFWLAAPDSGQFLYVSPAFERVWGRSSTILYERPDAFLDWVHPEDRAQVMDGQQRKAAGEYDLEYRMVRPDGAIRWLHARAFPVRDQRGEVIRVAGLSEDITERKEAEQALRRSEAHNRALLDVLPDLMFRISRAGVYLDFKADKEDDLAVPPSSVIGTTLFDALPADVAERLVFGIEQALQTGAIQMVEYQLVLNLAPRDFEARIVVCAENEVLAIVRDITERKHIERMKNEFVSTVSHELRTPLTSIRGSLGLIAGGVAGEVPERVKMMVDIAYKNSERLVRLINDILDIEKIESGNLRFDIQPLELRPLVAQAIEANRGFGQQLEVSFALSSAADDAWVSADGDRLTQAVTNLLSNAAKFSPPGAEVLVALNRRGGAVRVSISDRGPGIPESFRTQLFQKFAQADSSDSRQKGGTGLGLSITKAIVERLGGRIDFEPRLGGGTTFWIELPEWREQAPARVAALVPPRILIVEDDREVGVLLATILHGGGFATDVAHAAAAARQLLAERDYVALTLDLMLPNQEGFALIRDLRSQAATRNLPIVVVSAWAAPSGQELNGAALALIDWIEKPIDEQRLLEAVRQACRRPAGDRPTILHIEDEADIRTVVSEIVQDVADVAQAENIQEARQRLHTSSFDLIILDLELPDGSGLELLRELNSGAVALTPVVIFSVSEVGPETLPKVAAALVKSRTSNQQLLETIMAFIRRTNAPPAGVAASTQSPSTHHTGVAG
jgi:PAS domain S-box-containing protein